jgi:hypothetical protein
MKELSAMSRTSKRQAARPLGFGRLGSRICLAVDAVLDDNGLLTITGTPEDDTIVIRDNREGAIIVETRDPDDRFEPFAGVEQIVVNSLAGDDTVRYHVRHAGSIPAEFNLGDGEDELSAHVGSGRGDAADTAVDLEVNGGAGDDEVQVGVLLHSGRKFSDDAAGSSLNFAADLGGGNDRLRVGVHGAASASLDVTAGEGDDEVGIGMLLPAVQRIRVAAAATSLEVNADLGAGNDELRISGHGATETTIDVTAGAGDDDVRIGMLAALHSFRDADSTASIDVDLGVGNDELSISALGIKEIDLGVLAGEGDDEIQIGLLLPAVRPVADSTANVDVDLGPGADRLELRVRGYETVETDITGDEDDGDDVDLDIEPGPRPRPIPLPRPIQPPGRGRGR